VGYVGERMMLQWVMLVTVWY